MAELQRTPISWGHSLQQWKHHKLKGLDSSESTIGNGDQRDDPSFDTSSTTRFLQLWVILALYFSPLFQQMEPSAFLTMDKRPHYTSQFAGMLTILGTVEPPSSIVQENGFQEDSENLAHI